MAKINTGGFKTPIWRACDTIDIRPALQHAYIKDGFVHATNGYVLIKQSLKEVHGMDDQDVAFLEGKFIHRETLRELERYNVIFIRENGIEAVKGPVRTVFQYAGKPGKFPDFDSVIPVAGCESKLKTIGMNPKYIELAAKCMDTHPQGVKFTFYGDTNGIILTSEPYTREEQLAMVMPYQISE
jgi:hypothetical protein